MMSLAAIAKIVWAIGIVAWFAIRQRHARRARRASVASHRRTVSERAGLTAGALGIALIPWIYVITGVPRAADYPASVWALVAGTGIYSAALWLFWRAHRDLGVNWSITLTIREQHRLVTEGVYAAIRHPMYASFWLMALGQALLLPNWIAGPAGLVGIAILYFLRVDAEERMMIETFGDPYRAYMARTKRIVPGLY
jgi:protein-S-isoprenylcysteine O-methyltransferase Ste14